MPKTTPEVDAYLHGLDPGRRAALEALRALVLWAAPEVMETMRYRMPTYEYGDEMVCAFASQKHYISLYIDVEIVEQHRDALAGLSVGKSCISFRPLEQLPIETIEAMLVQSVKKRKKNEGSL